MEETTFGETPERVALERSGLSIENGQLVKKDPNGTVVGTFGLKEIEKAEAGSRINRVAFVFAAAGAALIYAAAEQWQHPGAVWAGYIGGGILLLFGVIGAYEEILTLRVQGQDLVYPINEESADLKTFVITLNRMKGSSL